MHKSLVVSPTLFLLCIACSGPAIEPSSSLVGARELPSERELSKETIFIGRGGDGYGGEFLSYEWSPDNSLKVTHDFLAFGGSGTVLRAQETLQVSPQAAAAARQLLWRLRPEPLDGPREFLDRDHRPVGCSKNHQHDLGEFQVTFNDTGSKPGWEDDRLSTVRLPYPDGCTTPAAVEARAVLLEALRLLPESKVAAAYEQVMDGPQAGSSPPEPPAEGG